MAADVTSVIRTLLSGPIIDRVRADRIIAAAGEDGMVSEDEKAAINAALTDNATKFTAGAIAKLQNFVTAPFALPATAGAFAMEKLLQQKDASGIDVPTLRRAQLYTVKPESRTQITLRHFSFMSREAQAAAFEDEFAKTKVFTQAVIADILRVVRAQLGWNSPRVEERRYLSLKRAGGFRFTFAAGENRSYDWEQGQIITLNVAELGDVIAFAQNKVRERRREGGRGRRREESGSGGYAGGLSCAAVLCLMVDR